MGGLSLQGLSFEEASRRLTEKVHALENAPITLRHQDEAWLATPKQLGATVGYTSPLGRAWRVGRRGSIFRRWQELLSPPAVDLPFTVTLHPNRLRESLHRFTPIIERDPKNASFDLTTGELSLEKPGRRIDFSQTLPGLTRAIRQPQDRRARLVFFTVAPRTTKEELLAHRARYLAGTFTTEFDPLSHVRAGNIRRGAQQINGILIPPDSVFSFNSATGPRDKANGYGEALEIINERLVPGVGGGICQVSSTLYNAVLLAGLPILERHPHSLPLGYVALGRDATVYYTRLDLVFKNDTPGNILLLTEVKENRITVAVFTERRPEEKAVIRTETLEVIDFPHRYEFDPQVVPGQERIDKPGQKGYKVLTERIFTSADQEIRRETISLDTYKPQAEVIKLPPPSEKKPAQQAPDEIMPEQPEPADGAPPRT